MPNLVDIVEMAEALESKAVFVAPERCNRHSSCKKCSEACPVGAVSVGNNVVSIDAGACMACGACTTVCPTEALIPLEPLDEDLASAIADATVAAGGLSVFACARMAAVPLPSCKNSARMASRSSAFSQGMGICAHACAYASPKLSSGS